MKVAFITLLAFLAKTHNLLYKYGILEKERLSQ